MSAKYCLPVPVFHFWLKLTHPAERGLSAIAELLFFLVLRAFTSTFFSLYISPPFDVKDFRFIKIS